MDSESVAARWRTFAPPSGTSSPSLLVSRVKKRKPSLRRLAVDGDGRSRRTGDQTLRAGEGPARSNAGASPRTFDRSAGITDRRDQMHAAAHAARSRSGRSRRAWLAPACGSGDPALGTPDRARAVIGPDDARAETGTIGTHAGTVTYAILPKSVIAGAAPSSRRSVTASDDSFRPAGGDR